MPNPEPPSGGSDQPPAIPPDVLALLHDKNSKGLTTMQLLLLNCGSLDDEDVTDQDLSEIIFA